MAETAIATRRPMSNYTDEEVELGLRALAACSGNSRRAAEVLRDEGTLDVRHDRLWRWQRDHQERYEQIQADLMPAIYARMAEKTEDIAARAASLEGKLIDRVEARVDDLDGDKAANALMRVSTTKGINIEKSLLLRGRPTSITAQADVTDLLKSLAQRYGDVVATADVVDAAVATDASQPVNARALSPPTSPDDRHADPKQSK